MKIKALIAFILLVPVGSGCERKPREDAEEPRVEVLCSFLPMWVFAKNVAKGVPGVWVGVLIPGHQGPHNYQLTPGDMKKINSADLFVVNGFHLEEFLSRAAKQARPGLDMLEAAEAVEPLYMDEEGRWSTGPREHGHGHEHRYNINSHPFASPRHAAVMVKRIGQSLSEVDPEYADMYKKNAADYAARLNELADRFRSMIQGADNKKVVTFHHAFAYLAKDSGLEIVGVIETSPGQMPSAGELSRLAERIRQSGASAVLAEPQYSDRLARVLAEEAGVKFAFLDPGATGELSPDSFENIMEKNLDTLERVLEQ